MQLPSARFSPSSKKIKKIHPEKSFLYFRKWNFLALILKENSGNGNLEKIRYISGNGTFVIFRTLAHLELGAYSEPCIFRTLTYLELEAYSEPWYIKNPDIFRTRSIFRALTYLELEAYSEP